MKKQGVVSQDPPCEENEWHQSFPRKELAVKSKRSKTLINWRSDSVHNSSNSDLIKENFCQEQKWRQTAHSIPEGHWKDVFEATSRTMCPYNHTDKSESDLQEKSHNRFCCCLWRFLCPVVAIRKEWSVRHMPTIEVAFPWSISVLIILSDLVRWKAA